ncbi:MAG: hypothetical protein AAFP78_06660 [Pseudomonadota bacterium]
MRRLALTCASFALAACARNFAPTPGAPLDAPPEPTENVIVSDAGELSVRRSPLSQPFLRRADYDLQATTIARGVSLVVEPAANAPVYISNLLAAALVRRFSGHEPVEQAMAAPVVFLIRPTVAVEALTIDGHLIVDWSLRTERGRAVGAAYAARRLSGAISGADPWTALTPEDAELIAIQTAANLLEVEALRAAIEAGAAEAQAALTPTPTPRPITVTRQGSQPAPRLAPAPAGRPAQSD